MSTLRENSRTEYTGSGSIDHIKAGAIQRIADACELMAKNHGSLIDERDRYKRWYEEGRESAKRQEHVIRGLRGRITILKADSVSERISGSMHPHGGGPNEG